VCRVPPGYFRSSPTRRSSDLVILGFGLALLLNQTFVGRRYVRAALLLPWIVPTVLSTMAFLWMFDSNLSSVNWVLRNIGLKDVRSEEHTSELQSRFDLVCRLL